jgi:hypothetical protein
VGREGPALKERTLLTLIMDNNAGGCTILRMRTPREHPYLAAVNAALERADHRLDRWLTNICPECDRAIDRADGEHALIQRTTPASPDPQVIVVVGCMGYWLIAPAAVGIVPAWFTRLPR